MQLQRFAPLALATTLATIGTPAAAQYAEPPPSRGVTAPNGVYVDHSIGMRNAGIALTVIGVLSAGVATVALVTAANPCDGACHDVEGLGAIPWMIGGLAAASVGAITLSIGIPLWVGGEKDELVSPNDPRAIERRKEPDAAMTAELQVSPTFVGLSLEF